MLCLDVDGKFPILTVHDHWLAPTATGGEWMPAAPVLSASSGHETVEEESEARDFLAVRAEVRDFSFQQAFYFLWNLVTSAYSCGFQHDNLVTGRAFSHHSRLRIVVTETLREPL